MYTENKVLWLKEISEWLKDDPSISKELMEQLINECNIKKFMTKPTTILSNGLELCAVSAIGDTLDQTIKYLSGFEDVVFYSAHYFMEDVDPRIKVRFALYHTAKKQEVV